MRQETLDKIRSLKRRLLMRRSLVVGAVAMVVGASVIATLSLTSGCESQPSMPIPPSGVAGVHGEPMARIRVRRSVPTVTIHSPGGLLVGPVNGGQPHRVASPARLSHNGQQFIIAPPTGQALAWKLHAVVIKPAVGPHLRIEDQSFPNEIIVHSVASPRNGSLPLDVVNRLPMEQYVPGVLAKELYSDWHDACFRAQAIAARSYAIHNLRGTRGRHYDMENTQASQAYIGVTKNLRALNAAAATRGVVLAHNGQVLQAYYSSTCGGTGQDAAAIYPNQADIAPLRGTQRGSWCKAGKYYRWRISRNANTLAARIAAWGQRGGYTIKGLQGIRKVNVTATNSVGRPTQFVIVDGNGRSFPIKAENLRFACNYKGAGLPDVPSNDIVRSSHVAVTVSGGLVTMSGAGYGHGVGGCQFGMQAMAQQGYDAPGILAFYYKGADLRKAY